MWSGLGAVGDGTAARDEVIGRYAEPWRHYHALQHLRECLNAFEAAIHLAHRPAEVEAALWFHDAVYDLKAADNEEQSAAMARQVLAQSAVAPDVVSRVVGLVMVTRHTAVPDAPDEQLLVDIDLSILGAPEARFAEYERQIRAEYAFVPEVVFSEKRRAILRSFLIRPTIYSTPYFYDMLEKRARSNLAFAAGVGAARQI